MGEKEKPRISRLTAIITQLQSKRIITASYLAAKHNVSVRTIYRDIRTLEKSGIPIITEEGKGYALMEGYQLPPILFSEDEANALITAEQLVQKNKDRSFAENYSNAIVKIRSVLKHTQKGKAELLADRVYFGENNGLEQTSDYLMQIQSAITNFRLQEIQYRSSENKVTSRKIEPFGIYNTNGNWLLIAYCRLRNDFRVFRVDFIQKLATLTERFDPHEMTMEEYFISYVKKSPHP